MNNVHHPFIDQYYFENEKKTNNNGFADFEL